MSLRTRRNSALLASLMFLAVACGGTTAPTTAPGTQKASVPPVATGTPAGPGATGTPAGPGATATPGGGEVSPPPSAEVTPGASPTGTGGVFRIYCCATDPRSLRPQAASGTDEISIIGGIQRGLLYYNPDLTLRPELATDMPDVSADGLTYTFKLGDHKYSDGTAIVAGDFVRAAKTLADPRNAFDYGYEMCWIAGVDDVLGTDFGCSAGDTPYHDPAGCADDDPSNDEVACAFDAETVDPLLDAIGVKAPDDSTVVYTLKTKTSFFTNLAAMWLFTPVPEAQTSWAEAADIISSGPFMIESWTHNSEMDLVPNPNWNGAIAPSLDRIEIHIGGDPAAAVAAWERGDLDEVVIPSSDVRRVLDTPAYADMINRGTTLSIEYYDFSNCPDAETCPPNAAVGADARIPGGSPSQNKNFRIALNESIDKAELIQVGFAGLGVVASTPTMPGIPGFPTNYDPYPFNLDKATADIATALDELGVPQPDPATVIAPDCPTGVTLDTANPQPECVARARVRSLGALKFGYNCDAGHDQRVLYLANAWRVNLGFASMDIRCTDFATIRTERRSGKVYDIVRNGWGADFPHPDNQNRDLFACGAGNNNSKYCNPDYDAKLNEAAAASSYDESVPIYQEAEKMLADDAPVIFLRYGEGVRLIQPYVTGIAQTVSDHTNPGDVFYETISIAPH